MRKGAAIGIGVTVIVFSIMVGIASLPDEVLLEPSPFESSQNPPEAEKVSTIDVSEAAGKISIPEEEPQVVEQKTPVVEVSSVAEEEPDIAEKDAVAQTQGKKIKVTVSDGVGAGDK